MALSLILGSCSTFGATQKFFRKSISSSVVLQVQHRVTVYMVIYGRTSIIQMCCELKEAATQSIFHPATSYLKNKLMHCAGVTVQQ